MTELSLFPPPHPPPPPPPASSPPGSSEDDTSHETMELSIPLWELIDGPNSEPVCGISTPSKRDLFVVAGLAASYLWHHEEAVEVEQLLKSAKLKADVLYHSRRKTSPTDNKDADLRGLQRLQIVRSLGRRINVEVGEEKREGILISDDILYPKTTY